MYPVRSLDCEHLLMEYMPDPNMGALTAIRLMSTLHHMLCMHEAHGKGTPLIGECSENKPFHTALSH